MYGFPPIKYIELKNKKKVNKVRSLPEGHKININKILLLTKKKVIIQDTINNDIDIELVKKIE